MAQAAWDGIVSIFQTAISGLIAMLNKIPGVNIETSFGDLPEPPPVPEIPGQSVPVDATPLGPQLPLQAPAALDQVQPAALLAPPLPVAAMPPAPVAKVMEQQPQLKLVPPPATALPAQPPAPVLPAAAAPVLKLVPSVPDPLAKLPASVPAQPEAIAPTLKALAAIPAVSAPAQEESPIDQVERNRQRLAQAAPSVSPVRPTAVPQGGLMSSIQNTTQNQDRGMRIEKVEIHTSKPMTPLELENMVSMAVG
ncbi:hypothetical protein D3C77_356850 [compost metagenome]